ncbi:coiled-coil domain-containing protein 171 isoform X2 [Fundulus heteroclitus]|uniref:coiled-coil domain-containing protein 171 isoform X2 n=1 Tax=Fundulus heteroclitus TaxID=8078 RepID=UPI00165AB580|nr:coiled-coil domain-containing protein 171 isoform X2 [Fundulus heteroclitus]
MQPGPVDRSGEPGCGRTAERRRTDRRTRTRSSKEETSRTPVILDSTSRQEKPAAGRGGEERKKEGGGDRGAMERSVAVRRAASVGAGGGEGTRELRWRLNLLEKEKLKLTCSHNQEVCSLQAEVARLRSSVERGEARRAELQYQLAASRRDRCALTERAAELQEALLVSQQARQEERGAAQQEVEERQRLIQNLSSEKQRLTRLLQDQEAALEESRRKTAEEQRERQQEAEVSRRRAAQLEDLEERLERSCREKELAGQRAEALESSLEAERAAHLESRHDVQVLQVRTRDLEAALAVERCGQQEAQRSLELLRSSFSELERLYSLEAERRGSAERALERLQEEFSLYKSEAAVALETERKATFDLSKRLEEEESRHGGTRTLLQQAAERQAQADEAFRDTLQRVSGLLPPAKHDGKPSPGEVLQQLEATLSANQRRLEESTQQVGVLLDASQKLQEENRLLQRLVSDQQEQAEEARRALVQLQEEAAALRLQSSDWSAQKKELQEELQREKEERNQEVQEVRKEAEARLLFLHRLHQRLLPRGILGDVSWAELCEAVTQRVEELTSDLQKAEDQVAVLQEACSRRSACVRQLQRSQQGVLARLEESVRSREEAWSRRHALAVVQLQSQLQLCRSQCDSQRDRASSLERRCSSLTSDLSRLQGLLSGSRREASASLLACALLGGALRHARRCVAALSQQKALLRRQLAERELLEQEVRRLADALGGQEEEEEEEERRRKTRRRWRKGVCAVLALQRWTALSRRTAALFQLERSGGSVAVCGDPTTASLKDENGEGAEGVCARWLRSKSLPSVVLSSMADLQGALANTASSPPDVISAARSGLSRLLDHLLDQSDPSVPRGSAEEKLIQDRQTSLKALVSGLQQHFLDFSQRLHSAEVERRSLRLEVANLKKGLQQERAELNRTALSEVRQQLSRKERSLRILGKHMSGVQKERRQLEEKLQRAEEQLRENVRAFPPPSPSSRKSPPTAVM